MRCFSVVVCRAKCEVWSVTNTTSGLNYLISMSMWLFLNISPWTPSPQWRASGRRSQRCSPTSSRWRGPRCHSVRQRAAEGSDLSWPNFTDHFRGRHEDGSCSLLLSRWAERRASAAASRCLCVPAGQPGAEECSRAAGETNTSMLNLLKLRYIQITSFL